MSFFGRWLQRLRKRPGSPPADRAPAADGRDGAEPSAGELRYRARTGAPDLPLRHRSGKM